MQRSPAACRVKYNRLLVVKENDRLLGKSAHMIGPANWLASPTSDVVKAKSKKNTKWSAEDVNTLKKLYLTKTSLKGMAMQLERTEKAIIARMYQEDMMGNRMKPIAINHTKPRPVAKETNYAKEMSASTIFDYVKKLELENKALQQRISEIQKILGGN